MAAPGIEFPVRRSHDEIAAEPFGLGNGLAGVNAVSLRRDRFGKNDAVAGSLVSGNDCRNGAKIRPGTCAEIFRGSPA